MKRNSTKFVFFASMLIVALVLAGCGLNQRSASQSDPVVVEPIDDNVTDPTVDDQNQDGQEPAPVDENNNQENTDTNSNEGETTDPSQPADDNEGATDNGDGQEQNAEGETPREEDPAQEQPADDEQNQDPNAEQPAVEEPTAIPPETEPEADPTPAASSGKHVVQAGQTLFSIAQQYGLTVQELAAANGIVNPNVLDVGQELTIPVAGTTEIPETAAVHIVSYGDTIYSIALRYGKTVEELALHNNLQNVNRIDVGDEIKIPN